MSDAPGYFAILPYGRAFTPPQVPALNDEREREEAERLIAVLAAAAVADEPLVEFDGEGW